MYTVPTMHAIFFVHCWVNMRPLNNIQLTKLQLFSSKSTNYKLQPFEVRRPPKVLLPCVPISVDWSVYMVTCQ